MIRLEELHIAILHAFGVLGVILFENFSSDFSCGQIVAGIKNQSKPGVRVRNPFGNLMIRILDIGFASENIFECASGNSGHVLGWY